MNLTNKYTILFFILILLSGCKYAQPAKKSGSDYASWFRCLDSALVVVSPYTFSEDTIFLSRPVERIVCMSSSFAAALDAIDAHRSICAVSGLRYISSPRLRSLADAGSIADVGYEASLDYEHILCLKPDIVLCYTTSASEPQYIAKLRSMGVKVAVLYDHLEQHPLARAEYLKFFGALVSRRAEADSLFSEVKARYNYLRETTEDIRDKPKVLLNIPYAGAWYIPGRDGYMSRLIEDAGGEVLGSEEGSKSSIITMEKAYMLSRDADFWLNPGRASDLDDLISLHESFKEFGPLEKSLREGNTYIYNNTRRQNAGGGNDFWESGAVRPDLVLEDLIRILHPELLETGSELHYYSALE